jgi:SAM-dependent methyltransferase
MDLGFAPPSNAYLSPKDLTRPERYYPLRTVVCTNCWLVQTEDYADAGELFDAEYSYFSSTSTSWLAHAAKFAERMINDFKLHQDSFVIEIASNDGYLLKNFVAASIPCLGIEPTASTAAAAERLGVPVWREFFGEQLGKKLASDGKQADLIVANNVYAHVPDINDFTRGIKAALKAGGTITIEFPHLMRLIEFTQFDTIYHEHFSYLSLFTACAIFKAAALRIWHVEELATHGGSLRIFGCHQEDRRGDTQAVSEILREEVVRGMREIFTYTAFQRRADRVKDDLVEFLIDQKRAEKTVLAYGAAAKGNTLLNYAGIKTDLIRFVCDAAPAKQGKYLPGSHLPILPPKALAKPRPDYVLILPWNIAGEVKTQLRELAVQGTRFVTAVPKLEIA